METTIRLDDTLYFQATTLAATKGCDLSRSIEDLLRQKVPPAHTLLLERQPMSKWDERFCELARFVSNWSKDPKARVGAVIASSRGGDVAVGYNGFPMGVDDATERLHGDDKLKYTVHAEQNAIIAAGHRTEGATLYVWGKPICANCAGSVIQAGVTRVVAPSPDSLKPTSDWLEPGKIARQMFKEADLRADFYVNSAEDPINSQGG